VVASNLNGVIWGCKTVGKQMISRRSHGCIINVSSLLAYKAAIGTSVYAASKAAQLGRYMEI
jgi:NAD(P)-dependent dehydrogenase (short-subunit alcohol dehydrogenase family)